MWFGDTSIFRRNWIAYKREKMSHFMKPINKPEQKKIMKKKEVLYATHAINKVSYLSNVSLISLTDT